MKRVLVDRHDPTALRLDGTHVRVRLRDRSVLYATIVRARQPYTLDVVLRPWGECTPRVVHLADIRSASVVHARWPKVARIARAQAARKENTP